MKPLSRDFRALVLVLALPLFLAAVFPYSTVGYRAAPPRADVPSPLSIVELTDKDVRAAIASARSAWRIDGSEQALHQRPELTPRKLTPESWRPALTLGNRTPPPSPASVSPDFSPFLPSVAAPRAERLPSVPSEPEKPAFSREDLLKPADLTVR